MEAQQVDPIRTFGAELPAVNIFGIRPGPYRHYKGGMYVVTGIVTHMDNAQGKMDPLQDPLVCYRDLVPIKVHVNGALREAHQVYARPLTSFTATVNQGGQNIKRFTEV